MMKRCALLTALGAGFLALTACCGGLIPNYEVLPVPADEARFPVGAQWNTQIGAPVGPGAQAGKVQTANGLESIHTTVDKKGVNVSLNVPLIKWISGSLGFESSEVADLAAKDLQHHFLVDTSTVTSNRPLLFETISAKELTFSIKSSREIKLDLQADASKLAKGLGADTKIELNASASAKGTYEVKSTRRLVIAIRVARSVQQLASDRSVISLTEFAEGKLQENGAFGYRFTIVGKPDPIQQKVKLLIENPYLPQWAGQTVEFTQGSPAWSHDRRDSILHPKDTVSQRDYIWDRLRLSWARDLAASEMIVNRQYQVLLSESSGIEGTR